jgi:DNA-binding MarR family transcriptional regulator
VISLTPKGLHALQLLIPRTHAMSRRLVGRLETDEREELLRLLTELVKAHERSAPGRTKSAR